MTRLPQFHYVRAKSLAGQSFGTLGVLVANPVTLAGRVDELVAQHGSLRKAARVLETDHSHLWRIKRGTKIPSDKLLRRMDLKQNIHYTRT